MTIEQTQQQILQFLTNIQANQAKEPTQAAESIIDDLMQGVTPITHADNLSTVGKRPMSIAEGPVVD